MSGSNIMTNRGDQEWHTRHCYGCGKDNPHGLHVEFPFDEETGEVHFTYRPPDFAVGAPGVVHGGVLAAVVDEAQGALCFHVGHFSMTDRLNVKYHKATPMDMELRVEAQVTAVRRRRLYTTATISDREGDLLVSSRAAWYLLPDRVCRRLFLGQMGPAQMDEMLRRLEHNRKRAKLIRQRLRENRDTVS